MEGNNSSNSCNCEGSCGMCHGSQGVKGMCGCCGGWSMHRMGHHGLLRLILGLVILGLVFKLGFCLGAFKGEYMSGGFGSYGDDRVMIYRGGMMDRYMMGGAARLSTPSSGAVTTSSPEPDKSI